MSTNTEHTAKVVVIEGQIQTWEDPIGCVRASFAQGHSDVRSVLNWKYATIVIGDKALPLSKVREMLDELRDAAGHDAIDSIIAEYGITDM